eukprot:CAMPEP_0172455564 /NCGR_PEP_ID=MMETSP1065-20121228/12129_1 /TAXON_ID=265537 /ORGANISM="Amphiprora paludosa, Strain CCMP125" /LENGTH=585 /DNA_ID=CAMNT_0013208029 /DNA_START=38 /DNA_END=1795 /DNA_ORIENTATION=+
MRPQKQPQVNTSTPSSDTAAVLVTGPSCAAPRIGDDVGVVKVEPERYETVQVPDSSTNGGRALLNIFSGLMGNGSPPQSPVELQEFPEGAVKIVSSPPPKPGSQTVDFDDCREYSYTTDDQDDNDNSIHNIHNHMAPSLIPADDAESQALTMRAFVLGKSYHPVQDYNLRRTDESNLFWFTYRCDFPEIAPYGITSDAGWGCMLRSAQMLLGQALRIHFKASRDWKPAPMYSQRRQDPFLRSMFTWFADFPSTTQNFYSLHNMVAAGIKYDKLPGEWYGPQTACYVLRDLVEMHERYQLAHIAPQLLLQQSSAANQPSPANPLSATSTTGPPTPRRIFRVHVAAQGTVYRDSIQALMTKESKKRHDEETAKKHQANPQAHPLDLEWEEELVETVGTVEWDTGLLLLIPARLGLDTFNPDYVKTVANYFSFPQSVGCLGGRVRGARWFYGAVSDGSKVFGLDPHTVQNAPQSRPARINGRLGTTIDLTDEYLRSCHTTYHEVLQLHKMDPSIALGFYCRNQDDLEHLFSLVDHYHTQEGGPRIFAVADAAPNYASRSDVMGGSMMDAPSDESHGGDSEDDDDFVML